MMTPVLLRDLLRPSASGPASQGPPAPRTRQSADQTGAPGAVQGVQRSASDQCHGDTSDLLCLPDLHQL